MNNLEKTLKKKNIRQIDLARKLGVSKERVNNWVRGKSYPNTFGLLKAISIFLDVPIEELFFNGKRKNK